MRARGGTFARCIHKAGGALKGRVGFMDGSKICMAHPCGMNTVQHSCYSYRKKFHCLVYQTITTPDGLIFHMIGPVESQKPDAYLYRASKIDENLSTHLHIKGQQYYHYADKSFVLRAWMQTAYPNPPYTEAHYVFNRFMNTVNISGMEPHGAQAALLKSSTGCQRWLLNSLTQVHTVCVTTQLQNLHLSRGRRT